MSLQEKILRKNCSKIKYDGCGGTPSKSLLPSSAMDQTIGSVQPQYDLPDLPRRNGLRTPQGRRGRHSKKTTASMLFSYLGNCNPFDKSVFTSFANSGIFGKWFDKLAFSGIANDTFFAKWSDKVLCGTHNLFAILSCGRPETTPPSQRLTKFSYNDRLTERCAT